MNTITIKNQTYPEIIYACKSLSGEIYFFYDLESNPVCYDKSIEIVEYHINKTPKTLRRFIVLEEG